MALILTESFDGVTSGAGRWTYWRSDNLVSTTYGRDGTKGMRSVHITGAHELCHYTFPLAGEVVFGGWVYWESGEAGNDALLELRSSGGNKYTLRPDATLKQLRFNETLIGTQNSFQTQTWHFLEMKVKPGVSVEIKLREETLYTAVAGGSGKINSAYIITGGNLGVTGAFVRYDSLYVLDTSGVAPFNDFLGAVKISCIQATSDGSVLQLTPSTGTTHYNLVSDASDATYVEGTPTEDDLYGVGTIGFTEDVLGVMGIIRAEDIDADWLPTLPIKSLVKIGTTTYESSPLYVAGAKGLFYPWPQNPDTVTTWAISEIEGAEWGVEVGL